MTPNIHFHEGDLPADLDLGPVVAVDTETLGLKPHRDRLCVVQLSGGDGQAHVVRIGAIPQAPNLVALLSNPRAEKLFHYARFDIASLKRGLGVDCAPIYCTKIASKIARTYTDKHGLKDLCRELLGVEISKQQQSSDWGADRLSADQLLYAATDVLHLHAIKAALEAMLAREGRAHHVAACIAHLPARAALDLAGWEDMDVFAH